MFIKIINRLLPIVLSLSVVNTPCEEIYKDTIDSCFVILESNKKWETLSIRIYNPKFAECTVQENDLFDFLNKALTKLPEKKPDITYKSIYMGRIIEYPWISKFLADSAKACPNWSVVKGKAIKGNNHTLVSDILNCKYIINPFNEQLRLIGYKTAGVSVEKILISTGKPIKLPQWIDFKIRVPFDAMLWFKLEKVIKGTDEKDSFKPEIIEKDG